MPPLVRLALSRGELDEFLEPEGVPGLRLPGGFPCLAVRKLPPPAPDSPPLAPGLLRQKGRGGWTILGPPHELATWSPAWPALQAALDRARRPGNRLRFADGETWDLGERTRVMGILNLTPDSFSDGGRFDTLPAALEQAVRLTREGADLLDLGGESTRPGAGAVGAAEEGRRVLPVLKVLRREIPGGRISIDTRRAAVARQALDLGADLINDVSGLGDPEMAAVIARAGCPVVIMHARGTPDRMQENTVYGDLLGEIADFLALRAGRAAAAGVMNDRILADPGLGFGKAPEGNEFLLRHLEALKGLGFPLLVGASRKMFVGQRSGVAEPAARLAGSLAAAVAAALAGAAILRVHDAGATRQALAVADALKRRP